MRQAMTGWLLVAGCLVLLGGGAFMNAQPPRGIELPESTIVLWRRYATEVEQGIRTPSAGTTRTLTETAIAQHEYALATTRLLRMVSGGVMLLGLLLVLDLARYRARHTKAPPPAGDQTTDVPLPEVSR